MIRNVQILLNNKLGSCDTVVPFILSLKNMNKNLNVTYSIFDKKSFNDIKKNEFLYRALYDSGKLYCRGSTGSDNYFIKFILKIKTFLFLISIFFKLVTGNTKIIHFGIFSYYQFRFLGRIFPKKIFFMEHLCWYQHENVEILNNILFKRSTRKKDELFKISKNIIYFNKSYLFNQNTDNSNLIFMENPRTYDTWVNYVLKLGVPKAKSDLKSLGYDYEKGYFLYILGYIGKSNHMQDENTLERLIPDTLRLLSENAKDTPILIKPHAITDLDILNKIIKKHGKNNVHITYLHPSVLSINAKLVISNYYSNTQADANFFGATTVEYSHYSEYALKATKGMAESPDYIDYFINNDPKKFKEIILSSVNEKKKNKLKEVYQDQESSSLVAKFYSNYFMA